MSSSTDRQWLAKCLAEIEDKLGWGSSAHWHNTVFDELSETIEKETHILLSPTTLKRVWGRLKYANKPSISTLDTLSQYLGYKNWREFKNQTTDHPSSNQSSDSLWSKNQTIIVTSAALLTLVFISFFSLIGPVQTGPKIEDLSQVEFSSKPVTIGMPNSVVFEFDLGDIRARDIKIQQYWDETKTIDISIDQNQATGIYYQPGYYRSKLLIDGQIIREHDLYIKSNGWLGTIDYEPIPKYFSGLILQDQMLTMPDQALTEIMNSDNPLISTYHYVEEFDDLSGDDFTLDATIQNIYSDKWAVCQRLDIYILGSKSAMIIPFSLKGCVSDLGVMLSEKFVSGKEKDLSSLGVDLSQPRQILVRNVDRQVSVLINDQTVYENSYEQSLGKFAGMRFRFLGMGQVRDLILSDPSGNMKMRGTL